MNEKISVIIPAYNIEEYLAATLDSVLKQTYQNLEVIVVNDGSKDHTGAIIDAYVHKDHRIHAIHKKNGGVTSARLRGLKEATGSWIAFVDGDDTVESDMYARLVKNADTHHAEISHCGYQMVFPDGHVDYYHNTGTLLVQKGNQGLRDLLSAELVDPGLWNKLYRRELLNGIEDKMDPSIRINEDVLMNYYLFQQASCCVFEDFCGYHYVLRKGSAATSKINSYKLRNPIQVSQLILADCDEELKPLVYKRLIRQLVSGAAMALSDQPELIRPFRKECRQMLRHSLMHGSTALQIGIKLKVMMLWAGIWPASYGLVHLIYEKVTGLDKIYEIK